ncbi:MAG: hypothetical protein ACEY3E_01825 [Candidatus Tisiphia sp.]
MSNFSYVALDFVLAAKLKAIEVAKVKEYVPEIPVVKLFEVADGDNQFDNDDQDTLLGDLKYDL